VAVYGGAEHGVCRRPQIGVCCREEDDGVRTEMGHAEVAASCREACSNSGNDKSMGEEASFGDAVGELMLLYGGMHDDVKIRGRHCLATPLTNQCSCVAGSMVMSWFRGRLLAINHAIFSCAVCGCMLCDAPCM
jgi:hypothetical protein